MELKKEQYEQIAECFPKQRKAAKISNLDVLNAALYVMENGCKWRSLPKEYGDWHVIYVRINRWAKKGVLEKAFLRLQQLGIIKIQVNVVSLDSTCIKVHPDGMGALKKTERKPSEEHVVGGTPNFIWSPHLIEMGLSFRCLPETVEMALKAVLFCSSSVRRITRFTF